ncbi:YDG domain-containing protein [Janthinobacterium sp. J1-1]|uniref:YDG domain-containing protein n=1 Tax=Janthinobacterium sp. J1-1 TaxID=3065910 RepID=UPI002810C8F0|nr:YDG domain-containing protein [Janthinobacterium sp. J1-1]
MPSGLVANVTKATIGSLSNITTVDKVYDASTKATVSGATFNGMVSGDSLSLSGSAVFADKNVGTAKAATISALTLGGLDAANYNLTPTTGSGTGNITPKAITVINMTALNKVYDGNTKATLSGGSLSGLVGSETLGLSGLTASFADKNAGNTKTVTASGSVLVNGSNGGLASNYSVTDPTGLTANITQKALTVTGMTAGTRVYDGTTAATLSGGALSGLVSGETLVLNGGSGVFGDKNAGAAKAVTVSGVSLGNGTGLAGNYTVANPTGVTGTITQKTLTVSGATAGNKDYDGSTKAMLSGGTLDGLIVGETLTLAGAFADKNVASDKLVTVSVNNGSGLAGNYALSNPTGLTATITPKAVSVSGATAGNKVYDGSMTATLSGGTLDGLIVGETLTLAGAFVDKNAASSKAVTVSVGDGSGLAGNYALSNPTGLTATIAPKALSVTGITAGNKIYDGKTTASVNTLGATFDGMVADDKLTASANGVFADKNAATDKTVTISGIALGGADAGNYKLASTSATSKADITVKALTLSGLTADSKTYDGTKTAAVNTAGARFDGIVSGDALTVGASAEFSDKNAATGKTVTLSGIALGGADAGNYKLDSASTSATTKADITARGLALSGLTADSKTYDGSKTAVVNTAGARFDGIVSGDALTAGASAEFSDKNAASGKTVTLSGIALGGADAGNYKLDSASSSATTKADITAKTLTLSGLTADSKTYDGTKTAAVNTAGARFDGIVSGDALTAGANADFSDKNAATGKTVTISGIALGGADAGNYKLDSASSSATTKADITAKTLTLSGLTADSKTYDGIKTAAVNTAGAKFDGIVSGDTLTAGASAEFSDKNAASGKTVTISGIALGGADAGNYKLDSTSATTRADITARGLALSGLTADSKTYDGTKTAAVNTAGARFDGIVSGDALTAGASAEFSDKNAATGKTVTISGIALGGADAGNYKLDSTSATTRADITAKVLTLSGLTADSKTYDGTKAAVVNTVGARFDGIVSGDVLTAGASAEFSDKNAASGKTVTLSGIALGGTDAGNYKLDSTSATTKANITARVLTLSGLTADSKTYDGTKAAVVNTAGAKFDGIVSGDALTAGASAEFSDKNAASGKTVTLSGIALGGADAGNYKLDSASSSATTKADITARGLTLSGLTADSKTYDGSKTAVVNTAGARFDGIVSGDALTAGASAEFSDKNAATGKTVTISGIALGGADAGNYKLDSTSASATADITAKALTINGQVAGNKVYDGNTQATLSGGTLSGLIGSETLGIAGQSATFNDKNAASRKTVTVTGTTLVDGTGSASNYSVDNPTGLSASITQKALTVTGQLAGNKVYDGNVQATLSGGALTGLVGSETLVIGGQTAVFGDQNAANGKTVTVTGTTLGDTANGLASNYSVSNPTGLTASITQKALTVTSQLAGNKVYDGNAAATLSGGTLNGLIGLETLGIAGQTAVFSDKNAANGKTVTVTGTTLVDTSTGLASNYSVSNPTGLTASITAKALTVTGQLAGNKVYDGNTAAQLSGGTLSGLVAGETLVIGGQNATFADKNAGTAKAVTVTGTTLVDTANGLASNYTVSNPTGLTASITAKALTVTGQLAGNKVYDGNAQASLSGGALSGLVAGETLGFGGQNAVFSDKNAANGKTVTVTGTTLVDTATGLASNYTVSNPTGLTASITAKALMVTGQLAGNKVYDGNAQASLSGGALSGLVAGETLGFGGQNAVFSDKNAANGKTVTVTGTTLLDTANGLASNYTVSNPTGLTASITAKALTVTGQLAGNKVYDGTAQASLSGGALSGLVAGETLVIGGQNATFADKNAGTAKAVTVTGTTLVDTSTGLARNYTVSNPTGLTASITPKALTVAGQLATNKVYDGTTAAPLSGGVLAGLVAGESLGLAGQTAKFADKNAATAKAVTVTGTTLVDTSTGLASNYTISNPTGLTASITPASLLVRATGAASRVYDTTTNASVTLGDNRIAGDVLTISNSGASFADKNAGTNKTVTVNGIALGGADAGNYIVNTTATTTASITQAALGVKVDNAEKDQGRANPAFTASYTGLLGGDTLANEVSGNLAFTTPATTGSPSGSYVVSAAGQASTNYALTYTPGVLTVNPTEALQSAVASVIAAVNVAPSQGNMVQAEVVAKGETVTSKEDAVQVAVEGSQPQQQGSAPVVQTTASVNSNVLPGLRLNVIDTGLRLPVGTGNSSVESE